MHDVDLTYLDAHLNVQIDGKQIMHHLIELVRKIEDLRGADELMQVAQPRHLEGMAGRGAGGAGMSHTTCMQHDGVIIELRAGVCHGDAVRDLRRVCSHALGFDQPVEVKPMHA